MGWKPFLIGALLVLTGVPACNDSQSPAAPERQGLEVHIQSHFENHSVQVSLDDQPVFYGFASTLSLVGLALVVNTTAERGPHLLSVRSGEFVRELQFELREYSYAIISRDAQTGELNVRVTLERPLYD